MDFRLFFAYCHANFDCQVFSLGRSFRLHIKAFGDAAKSCGVFLHIVQLGDLRSAVSQQVGHLSGRQRLHGSVGLLLSNRPVWCNLRFRRTQGAYFPRNALPCVIPLSRSVVHEELSCRDQCHCNATVVKAVTVSHSGRFFLFCADRKLLFLIISTFAIGFFRINSSR